MAAAVNAILVKGPLAFASLRRKRALWLRSARGASSSTRVRAALVVALLLMSGGAARAEFLDWTDVTWTAGALGPRAYTGGDLGAITTTVTVTDASNVRPAGFPVIQTGYNGFDNAFRLRADFANTSQVISLRYDLSAPASNLRFDVGDIDAGSATSPYTGWQDVLVVTAFRGGVEVPVTVTSMGSAVGQDTSNAYTTGSNAVVYGLNGDIASTSTAGNATFSVAGPVDQIRIDYRAGSSAGSEGIPGNGPANPIEQGINFHDLVFDAKADLALTKIASSATPNVGDTVTYTLTLTNAGPAAATGVTVVDSLPAGLAYVANSIAGGSSRSAAPPTLTWGVTTLASGASTNLTFQATVNSQTGASGEYDNRAQVTVAPQPDPDSTPNNGTANGEDDAASAVINPPLAGGSCSCGYQDGVPTQTSIALDGSMSDWNPPRSDRDNVACDGVSASDRDAPVQSTGRNLSEFTFTWDGAYLYAYTGRAASDNNIDKFIYYADTDNDGLMESGERVLVARWRGTNRSVDLFYGTYSAASSGGDPLQDGAGFADGYDMPGTITGLPPAGQPNASGTWGSADGVSMEWRVPWSVLGVAPGAAIRWHISSTNAEPGSGSLVGQIDDNLGGCGGCAGGTQYGGVTLVPNGSAAISGGTTTYIGHTLTNTGNGSDRFDLSSTSSGSFTPASYAYYRDLGTVGSYDAGVDVLLTDTDGDSIPDTGPVAAAATFPLLVAVTAPAASITGSATVVTTARSNYVPACGSGTAVSAVVTDTLTVGIAVSGFVYADVDHDGDRTGAEAGTGLVLYAKLIPAATPTGPALAVVAVDPVTGAFSFPIVAAGAYTLLIDTSSVATDVTPTATPGWLATEEPDATRSLTVASSNVTDQDFGLFHGSRVEGVVFEDDGSGGGVAGNGLLDGLEGGIGGATLRAEAAGCGGVCDSDTSGANGAFALWIPFAANGAPVRVIETNAAGFVSTGGSPGTTGGSYVLATDTLTFSNTTGTVYTAVRFGDFSGSSFAPNHQRAAMPGTAVFYPHVFAAGPSGSVRFSATHVASPNVAGWAQSIFHDTDCSATLDASEPQLQPGDAIAVAAGGIVCVIVRESVPSGAASGTQDLVTVTANFSAAGGAAASFDVTDLTTVGLPSGLTLLKHVDKSSAEPGEVLLYTIIYRNDGAAPITQLVISDATPSYTTYVPGSASCASLPPQLTSCTPAPPPGATGSVTWSFSGALDPGASGTVTYSVSVE